jgi:hypothetical protein
MVTTEEQLENLIKSIGEQLSKAYDAGYLAGYQAAMDLATAQVKASL